MYEMTELRPKLQRSMMQVKTALITGISGQDGSLMCEHLLNQGYDVHGLIRPHSTSSTPLPLLDPEIAADNLGLRLMLHHGDVLDPQSLLKIFNTHHIDEVYHFAAQSDVAVSFEMPDYVSEVNALGTLRVLQAILAAKTRMSIKFYNACSSEVFGRVQSPVQNESTPFYPQSPYAAAKAYSYWITVSMREAYGLFAVNGILFNHESPRRGHRFVTRKITKHVAEVHCGRDSVLCLGNLDARRDWGHASDYVRGIHLMLQHHSPGDYVLATGESRTVREFATAAFAVIGVKLRWEGQGADEVARDSDTGVVRIRIDPAYYRPLDVPHLCGSAAKAEKVLKWKPTITFEELVREMVEHDINALQQGDALQITRQLSGLVV